MSELKVFTEGEAIVKNRQLTRLVGGFGEDKHVITSKQIAELMGYELRVVNQAIERNIGSFEENVDIIDLKR